MLDEDDNIIIRKMTTAEWHRQNGTNEHDWFCSVISELGCYVIKAITSSSRVHVVIIAIATSIFDLRLRGMDTHCFVSILSWYYLRR